MTKYNFLWILLHKNGVFFLNIFFLWYRIHATGLNIKKWKNSNFKLMIFSFINYNINLITTIPVVCRRTVILFAPKRINPFGVAYKASGKLIKKI